MSDMSPTVINAETENYNATPYGQARVSNGFFHCAETCRQEDPVVLKYLLHCMSIELGLKAAVLSRDGSEKKEGDLKKIGHDLVSLYDEFAKVFSGDHILDKCDLDALKMINKFYLGKGLEYFTVPVKYESLLGHKSFPTIDSMELASRKVNGFLNSNKYFI